MAGKTGTYDRRRMLPSHIAQKERLIERREADLNKQREELENMRAELDQLEAEEANLTR